MKKYLLASAMAVTVVSASAAGQKPSWLNYVSLSANSALVSNYMWRGVTQSGNSPAAQAGLDLAMPWDLSVGIWGSNVNFADADSVTATVEVDYYANWARSFGKYTVDAGWLRYTYPQTRKLDWSEYHVGVNYALRSNLNVGASMHYTKDVFDADEHAKYYEVNANYDVPAKVLKGMTGVGLNAHVGHYNFKGTVYRPQDYSDYGLGITKTLTDRVNLGLSWIDTNDGFSPTDSTDDDSRFVASINASF